ncbi:MAG: universal stress protein [Gemmatimonadota bacterium]
MFTKILVGIDFSDPSISAMRWTVDRFPDADFVLFHAVEPEVAPNYLRQALGAELDLSSEMALDAKSNLQQVADEENLSARLLVGQGWASEVLNEAARSEGADLIVIGARRPRHFPWTDAGDTAVRIVDRATVPVLLWRPPQQTRDKTVLAALDLRPGSAPIAATGARFARHFGARLLLVHALPNPIHAYLKAVNAPAKAEQAQRAIEEAARAEAVERVPEDLREGLELQTIILTGRPITAWILSTAETEAADLIVAGRSPAPGIAGRAQLGGITARLMGDAASSVLVVPV